MISQEGYTLTNGETYSPSRDDKEFNSKVEKSRFNLDFTQWLNSCRAVRYSSKDLIVALNRIFDQSVVTLTPELLSPIVADVDEDIWQAFERVLSQFPEDVLSDLPKDLSIDHDNYLYDTPKKS